MQPGPDNWYIGVDGNSHGPYSFAMLIQAASDGRLTRETLVWSPGMSDWTPAEKIQGLFLPPRPPAQSALIEQPLPPKDIPVPVLKDANEALTQAVAPERPGLWRRFFARWIDVQLSASATIFGAAVVLSIVSAEFGMWVHIQTNSTLFALLLMPLAFVVDAVVVAIFGNSLGKTVLGLHVRRTSGESLSFFD